MAITKKKIMKALRFWQSRLNESGDSVKAESEEDQKKEAAAE